MSAITAIAPWFGGKRTMAPAIVEHLGPHSIYWEPFCGSMAVLLAKPATRTEVVNDLHADLVNLARVIQHPALGPILYRRLRRVWSSQDLFADSLEIVRQDWASDGPDVERAFHYFVASWQGMNGMAGTSEMKTNYCRRFSSLGGDAGARWAGAVLSIPAWRARMERVQVLRTCGIELCEKIEDRERTVIYADPPYLAKGASYKHDFAEADHARLAAALRRFRRTRVVLSYYADPRLSELYPGWTLRPIEVTKGLVNQGKRGRKGATRAVEVLLMNRTNSGGPGPLFGEGGAHVS